MPHYINSKIARYYSFVATTIVNCKGFDRYMTMRINGRSIDKLKINYTGIFHINFVVEIGLKTNTINAHMLQLWHKTAQINHRPGYFLYRPQILGDDFIKFGDIHTFVSCDKGYIFELIFYNRVRVEYV